MNLQKLSKKKRGSTRAARKHAHVVSGNLSKRPATIKPAKKSGDTSWRRILRTTNRLGVRRSVLTRLISSAVKRAKDGDREICGLLVFNGLFLDLLQTENKSRRGGSFSFYAKEYDHLERCAQALGYEVVGTFHSHPLWVAKPSEGDLNGALDNSLMLIIDCMDRNARLWHVRNRKASEIKLKRLPDKV